MILMEICSLGFEICIEACEVIFRCMLRYCCGANFERDGNGAYRPVFVNLVHPVYKESDTNFITLGLAAG